VEPVVGNGGFIPPVDGFLPELRRITEEDGALLIFDEVMTGFRVAPAARRSASASPGPDDAGEGDRRRAAGGRVRRPARDHGAGRPLGPIYQAGTLSGNPLAMAAGLAQLRILRERTRSRSWSAATRRLVEGLLA
jgi:glutamate-1-semialdehyde 2,1-aminomutase